MCVYSDQDTTYSLERDYSPNMTVDDDTDGRVHTTEARKSLRTYGLHT